MADKMQTYYFTIPGRYKHGTTASLHPRYREVFSTDAHSAKEAQTKLYERMKARDILWHCETEESLELYINGGI